MPRARANGVELEYDCFGDRGAEPVLLISGLGTQMIRWTAPFCVRLAAQGYRVVRFDNRDVGLSTHFGAAPVPEMAEIVSALMRGARPDVPYSLGDMAGDAVGLLDALELERAHIVGRSMGGMIALIAASEHPDRALSLTSIMSTTGNPVLPRPSPEVMAALTSRAPDPSQDEEGFLAHSVTFARLIGGPGYPFEEAKHRDQALAEARRSYDPAGFARQLAAMVVAGDLRKRLKEITIPTLAIHGANDRLISPAGSRDIAANIDGAMLRIIEGMGHDIPPALYEEIIAAVAENARRAIPAA